MTDKNTAWKIDQITGSLNSLLKYKNENYGDAALSPLKIFSKTDAVDNITSRLDEKLARLKNSESIRKNDVVDFLGGLVLLCASKDWLSFEEFKD